MPTDWGVAPNFWSQGYHHHKSSDDLGASKFCPRNFKVRYKAQACGTSIFVKLYRVKNCQRGNRTRYTSGIYSDLAAAQPQVAPALVSGDESAVR